MKVLTTVAVIWCSTVAWAQPAPTISSLSPAGVLAGSPGFTLTITGAFFTSGIVLIWDNNQPLPGSVVSSNQLTVQVPASYVASAESANLFLQNTSGTRSNSVTFTVTKPAITLAPAVLPACVAGTPYTVTFTATGGTPPYRWSFLSALPSGLTLNAATGMITGTPDTRGSYTFSIVVTDSNGVNGVKTFTLAVTAPALSITSVSPIFNGTLGLFYSQTFQASGGVAPYKWALLDGQLPSGLTFDPATGSITGTPTTTGISKLTVQVIDSDGSKVSKDFQFTVDPPRLTITTLTPLANGMVGNPYSQQFTAGGGTPPYTWSATGSAPGLSLDASGMLSGTASAAGSFSITAQVKDAAGATASKSFTLLIAPAPLTITSSTRLADGVLGVLYSQSLTVSGGTAPYTWSANGLPDGLTLSPETGVLSGTPLVGGDLVFTVRVTDAARAAAVDLFRMTVSLPLLPDSTITGLPDIANPADQVPLRLSIQAPYPIDLSGQLTLSFAPDAGGGDATIQFISGGRTAAFTIPAGKTDAQFAVPTLALQTGTLAGSITIAAQFQAGGSDITPNPAPARTTHINRSAPVIAAANVVRSDKGLSVSISGFSTTREVGQAVFHFHTMPGNTLDRSDLSIQVDSLFAAWYQNAASARYGGQFTFTQPFTISGDPNAVILDSVTLTNRAGSTSTPVY